MTSSTFSVVVGEGTSKTFLIHSALLRYESDRLAKDIDGGFKEEKSSMIVLNEEDPGLFSYFVEYLYENGSAWVNKSEIQRPEDYVIAARLYALGERLQAKNFQHAVFEKFMKDFNAQTHIGDQGICDLLDVVCTELPERVQEDQLRAQVFWYAAGRLDSLKNYDYFVKLLETHGELGKEMCLRASPSVDIQPEYHSQPLVSKFIPASIY